MKAMILAAGKGTRLMPLTADKPKVLVEVQGIPLIQHTIQYLKYHGVDEIIINIHHYASQVIDFIKLNNSFGIHIAFSDESEALLDTGGGLYKARQFFDDNEPFVLTSSDVITDLNLSAMLDFHQQNNPIVTLAVKQRKATRDFVFDENLRLCGWFNNINGESRLVREALNPKRFGFSTIHIINPAIFKLIIERGAFSIIDLYLRLCREYPIMGFEHNESLWFECGKIETLNQLNHNSEIDTIYKKYHKP